MSLYSLRPTVVLPAFDRRSRSQREERGEAESENELDLHIGDVLRSVHCDTTGLLLLMDVIANKTDSNEP
jgi:hypothetical protein